MSSFAQNLVTAPVNPDAMVERICPVQLDSMHEDYRQVKPLEEMSPFRRHQELSRPYRPDDSDLLVSVNTDKLEEYKGRDRIMFSLVDCALVDTSTGKMLDERVLEDLADCRLVNLYRLIGGHPTEDAVRLRDLMYLTNFAQRVSSFYTFLEPQDPELLPAVDFTEVLPVALKGLKPHPAYWKARDLTMHWVDIGAGQVYSKHPRDFTVVSSTDMADAILQTFFVCKGIFVTGTFLHQGDHWPAYSFKTRAPLFTVSRHMSSLKHSAALREGPDYLSWLAFWHRPQTVLNRRPRMHISDRWRDDRSGQDYPLTRFRLAGIDVQMAWFFAYLSSTGQFGCTRMLPARYLEFYSRTRALSSTSPFAYRSAPKNPDTTAPEPTLTFEYTTWSMLPESAQLNTGGVNDSVFLKRTFKWGDFNPAVLMVKTRQPLAPAGGSQSRYPGGSGVSRRPAGPSEAPTVTAERERRQEAQRRVEEETKAKADRLKARREQRKRKAEDLTRRQERAAPERVTGPPPGFGQTYGSAYHMHIEGPAVPTEEERREAAARQPEGEVTPPGEEAWVPPEQLSKKKKLFSRSEIAMGLSALEPGHNDFVYVGRTPEYIPRRDPKTAELVLDTPLKSYLREKWDAHWIKWRSHVTPEEEARLGFKLPAPGVEPEGDGPRLYSAYRSCYFSEPVTPLPEDYIEQYLRAPKSDPHIQRMLDHFAPRLIAPSKMDISGEAAHHKSRTQRIVLMEVGDYIRRTRTQKGGNLGEELAATKAENRQLQEEVRQLRLAKGSGLTRGASTRDGSPARSQSTGPLSDRARPGGTEAAGG